MAYEVTEDLAKHYDAVRQARGWSWETLAESFERQVGDPASPRLAKWAREQAEADTSARGKRNPDKETRGGDTPPEGDGE